MKAAQAGMHAWTESYTIITILQRAPAVHTAHETA